MTRRFRIVVCRGPECGERRGSAALGEVFTQALDQAGCRDRVEVSWQSCFGRCTQGPNVLVRELLTNAPPTLGTGFATAPGPRGTTALYNRIDADRAALIVRRHVVDGQIVRELIEPPGISIGVPVASTTVRKP